MAKVLLSSSSPHSLMHKSLPTRYLCLTPPRYINRTSPPRLFHTSPSSHAEYVPQQPKYPQEQPRWQQTPPRMAAPFRSKPPVDDNDFAVNEDPVKLDRVYEKVLGRGGDKMLTEEVKWLAVTHKSFDHGRRGYNDRLCFLGTFAYRRRISATQRDYEVLILRPWPRKKNSGITDIPGARPRLLNRTNTRPSRRLWPRTFQTLSASRS